VTYRFKLTDIFEGLHVASNSKFRTARLQCISCQVQQSGTVQIVMEIVKVLSLMFVNCFSLSFLTM